MRVVTSAETAGSSNRSGGALAMMKVAPLSSLFDHQVGGGLVAGRQDADHRQVAHVASPADLVGGVGEGQERGHGPDGSAAEALSASASQWLSGASPSKSSMGTVRR